MPDKAHRRTGDQTARYARGELSPQEARKLAQASLADADLFEELTASALAKSALERPGVRAQLPREPERMAPVRSRLFARVWAPAAVALAAGLAVAFYIGRPLIGRRPPAQTPLETAAVSEPQPALESSGGRNQPILMASGLKPPAPAENANVFRGANANARGPRQIGRIVSIEEGLAVIDLGSLDGLGKGDTLPIFRSGRTIGRLVVSSTFRESARGRMVPAAGIQVHDQVRLADGTYLGALLDRVDSLSRQGNTEQARAEASNALQWAHASQLPASDLRNILRRLAALEYRAGLSQAAETHYRAAVDTLRSKPGGADPDSAEVLNDLGVLYLLRGNSKAAEGPLNQALSVSPKPDWTYARISNNLGVSAEMHGNRKQAAALYGQALNAMAALPGSAEERRLVETNLARVKDSR